MALEIYWSKRADKKFDKILAYLMEEWGERVAKLFVRKVHDFPDVLSDFPEIGTIENQDKGIRGFTIVKIQNRKDFSDHITHQPNVTHLKKNNIHINNPGGLHAMFKRRKRITGKQQSLSYEGRNSQAARRRRGGI